MRILGEARDRFRAFLNRNQEEREMDEELRFHLDMAFEANQRQGMPPAEARRQAAIAFGAEQRVREEVREARGLAFLEVVGRDVRYAVRGLIRNRAFSVAALVTLALGIGATTAIFSVVSAVVLRPLPFPHADRLVQLYGGSSLFADRDAVRNLGELRTQNTTFDAIASYEVGVRYLQGTTGTERLSTVRTEPDFFSVLGARPLLGRTYVRDDPPDVAVVSEDFWRRRLRGQTTAIGSAIVLDGQPLTVIGVMPASFQFPCRAASLLAGVAAETRSEVWLPFERSLGPRSRMFDVIGRLSPAASIATAEAELNLITTRVQAEDPATDQRFTVHVEPLARAVISPSIRRPLLMLLLAAGLVLALACANVTNLSLVRASRRNREVAVRLAMGASRARLARQFLTESLLLALGGGAIGLALAWAGTRWSMRMLASRVPRAYEVGVDWRVFLFLLAACALTAVVVGLAPAVVTVQHDTRSLLRDGDAHATMGRGQRRLRDGLLISEVALACLLAICATLLIRELARLRGMDLGMVQENVVTLHVGSPRVPEDDGRRYYEIAERVAQVPGVGAVGFTQLLPLQSWGWWSNSTDFFRPGEAPQAGSEFPIELRFVTPGYFDALRIPVRGRAFTELDDAATPPVILINETLAQRYFGDADPIGVEMNRGTIVGVVADVRQVHAGAPSSPEIYTPIAQNWSQVSELGMTLVIRTEGSPEGSIEPIRAAIREVDPTQAIFRVQTMDRVVSESLADFTFYLYLMTAFAGLALLLASGGAYGVVAYIAASRGRELAIRAAIGADAHRLVSLVLRQGIVLVAVGVSMGTAAGVAATPLLRGLPIEVRPSGVTLLSVAIFIALVAVAACAIPARRAANADPMAALRSD